MKIFQKRSTKNNKILNKVVLVLNANYAPMMVCSARHAICMVYLKKVDVLVNYTEKIKSPTKYFDLPSVIKIRNYVRHDNLSVDLNRKNIISRDESMCQYCGNSKTILTIDHIVPKGRGGMDLWENLVTACKSCNQKKGNKTPDEAGMPLMKKPKRPNRLHFFQKFITEKQLDWKPYLFMDSFGIN